MTHRQDPGAPAKAASGPQGASRRGSGAPVADESDRPSGDRVAVHRAAIADVMLLGLEGADLAGDDGIRRIHEWADWLAEQAAIVTAAETRQLRAERDLLASTLAAHTGRTTTEVLAETREALAHLETEQ
ncbi:hypothetical protein [Streptomyces lydicus]|uniref:hypothetical protein n=1 Tax=Streptomyces lydicus TaxID=47763 RepID=UPI00331E192B